MLPVLQFFVLLTAFASLAFFLWKALQILSAIRDDLEALRRDLRNTPKEDSERQERTVVAKEERTEIRTSSRFRD